MVSGFSASSSKYERREGLFGIWKLDIAVDENEVDDRMLSSIATRTAVLDRWLKRRLHAGNNTNDVVSEDPFDDVSSSSSSSSPQQPLRPTTTTSDGTYNIDNEDKGGILIKMNPDGTFRQCNEDYQEGRWLSGQWSWQRRECRLLLAVDRQYYGPSVDVLLEGTIANQTATTATTTTTTDDAAAVPASSLSSAAADEASSSTHQRQPQKCCTGIIRAGKFMYPKHHPRFFERDPLVEVTTPSTSPSFVANFTMHQVLATDSILLPSSSPPPLPQDDEQQRDRRNKRYKPSDFYGKKFYLTVEPIRTTDIGSSSSSSLRKQQQRQRRQEQLAENVPVDLRAMSIEFFPNNTFAASGTNKILRGRFGIVRGGDGDDDDDGNVNDVENTLWFGVSIFGAGRSAPGSVYSEGLGLNRNEDERTYVGEILEQQLQRGGGSSNVNSSIKRRLLYVSGTVTFGSDLGSDARPEPVGTFHLTPQQEQEQQDDDDDDDCTEESRDLLGRSFQ